VTNLSNDNERLIKSITEFLEYERTKEHRIGELIKDLIRHIESFQQQLTNLETMLQKRVPVQTQQSTLPKLPPISKKPVTRGSSIIQDFNLSHLDFPDADVELSVEQITPNVSMILIKTKRFLEKHSWNELNRQYWPEGFSWDPNRRAWTKTITTTFT